MKELSAQWGTMSQEDKQPYVNLAHEDKQRYENEIISLKEQSSIISRKKSSVDEEKMSGSPVNLWIAHQGGSKFSQKGKSTLGIKLKSFAFSQVLISSIAQRIAEHDKDSQKLNQKGIHQWHILNSLRSWACWGH